MVSVYRAVVIIEPYFGELDVSTKIVVYFGNIGKLLDMKVSAGHTLK